VSVLTRPNLCALALCTRAQEDRVIRFLLARDDRELLRNLIYIENNGITKRSIGQFRKHLDRHLHAIMNSPQARARAESNGGSFFGGEEGEDGENKPPERPNTALPEKEVGVTGAGGAGESEGGGVEVKKPFQVIQHKVRTERAEMLGISSAQCN
jgi:hypothetical protein